MGPLLFLLFINDIGSIIDCKFALFADDLKIYYSVESVTDCEFIQGQLNKIETWCTINKLYLNTSKCKIMSISLKKQFVEFEYRLNSSVLSRCNSNRDLGITFDSKWSFNGHISLIVSAALKMLGFLIRN